MDRVVADMHDPDSTTDSERYSTGGIYVHM